MYRCMDGYFMDVWMDGCVDGWMDGCVDGWNGWMYGSEHWWVVVWGVVRRLSVTSSPGFATVVSRLSVSPPLPK